MASAFGGQRSIQLSYGCVGEPTSIARPHAPALLCRHGRFSGFGRRGGRLGAIGAQVLDRAAPAFGSPRLADIAAVQDQPVMGMDAERRGRRLVQLEFDRQHRLALGQPGAVADAEDMRVDREGLLPEGGVEHHIGGLAPDPRQALERGAILGHFAAIVVDQHLRQRDDVLGLGVEQADRLDVLFQPLFAQLQHLLRRIDLGEQGAGRLVDADIGRLRRQRDRDDQRIGVAIFQLGLGMRVRLRQPVIELDDIGLLHGRYRPSTSPMR